MKTFTKALSKVLCGLFAAVMLITAVLIFTGKMIDPRGKAALAGGAYLVFACAAAALFERSLGKSGGRAPVKTVLCISAAYFVLILAIASFMRYTPVWDCDAVFTGAVNWGAHGSISFASTPTFDANTYFYYFPNNLGCMGFLALFFRICAFFGVKDFLFAGFVLCSALCAVSLAATSLAAFELGAMYSDNPRSGRTAAAVTLVLYLLTPPMLFCAHVVYTDFLSMPFGILSAYLLFRAVNIHEGRAFGRRASVLREGFAGGASPDTKEPSNMRSCALLLAASALSACIGVQLKATVGIVIAAGALCLVLRLHWKLLLAYIVPAAAFMLIFTFALDLAVYPRQLDRETADKMNTPTLHWVMMGLEGSGVYSPEAYEFTRSFSDPEERSAAIKSRIGDRLRELGAAGLTKHIFGKLAYIFSGGTAAVGNFVSRPDADGTKTTEIRTRIFDFVNPSGKNYTVYKLLSFGARLSSMLLFAAFGIALIFEKRINAVCVVPLMCMFGIMLFLGFWEANERYIINMLPFLLLSAGCGAERIGAGLLKLFGRLKKSDKKA